MKLDKISSSRIRECIANAVSKYADNTEQSYVIDLYLHASHVTGELTVSDDNDQLLASVVIDKWVSYEDDDFDEGVQDALTKILNEMKDSGAFDKVNIVKPYSFVMVDEDKETISELLLMDDDLMIVDDSLLKGLDDELNQFLDDLLKE